MKKLVTIGALLLASTFLFAQVVAYNVVLKISGPATFSDGSVVTTELFTYNVYRAEKSTPSVFVLIATNAPSTFTNIVANNTIVYYRVTAVLDGLESLPSNIIKVNTVKAGPPNITATITN